MSMLDGERINGELEDVQAGDMVAVWASGWGGQKVRVRPVEKIGGKVKRRIYVDGLPYDARGFRIGGSYSSGHITVLDERARLLARDCGTLAAAEAALSKVKPADLTPDQRDALVAALRPFLPAQP